MRALTLEVHLERRARQAVAPDQAQLEPVRGDDRLVAQAPGQKRLRGLLDAEVVQGLGVGEEHRHRLWQCGPLGRGPVDDVDAPPAGQPRR